MSVSGEITCRADALEFQTQPREVGILGLGDMDVR
jgi:hypothetical protein